MALRKPRFVNKPENVTLKGTPRVKGRTFLSKEIEFLLEQKEMWKKGPLVELTAIQNNFLARFKWRPNLGSLKSFYQKKTYQWVWEGLHASIPTEKPQARQYNNYDAHISQIQELLNDAHYGATEATFKEGIADFIPELQGKLPRNAYHFFRKKLGFPTKKNKVDRQTASQLKQICSCNGYFPAYEKAKEMEVELSTSMYSYYRRKSGQTGLSLVELKEIKARLFAKSISLSFLEVHYKQGNKFLVEKVGIPDSIYGEIVKLIVEAQQ